MKTMHMLIIKKAIEAWIAKTDKIIDVELESIICSATRFNWEIFHAAKVGGNSITFLASELYPYLTADHITDALMHITGVNGAGVRGSGVIKPW